jgi:hypothetical protein
MRLADCRTWFAMCDEAGFSTQSVIWQATCILLSCDANRHVKCKPKPPTVIPAWKCPAARAQFSK